MNVRRVVTGHDASHNAVFVSDEEVKPVTSPLLPGSELHRLWGGDEPPTFPDDGVIPPQSTYFPPVGGYRFGFFTVPPKDESVTRPNLDFDVRTAMTELEEQLPGLMSYVQSDDPGMHTTDTVDFEVVLSGRVILELDHGAITELRAGDTVVQNGTRHRWTNSHDVPAVIAVFMVGAKRR